MAALGGRVADQGFIGNQRRSKWCDDCKARVSSSCSHIPLSARTRRRMAAREAREQ